MRIGLVAMTSGSEPEDGGSIPSSSADRESPNKDGHATLNRADAGSNPASRTERVTSHSLHSESIDVVVTDDPAWPLEVRVGRGTDIHLSAAGAARLYLLLGLAIKRVSADLESALTTLPEVNVCE